MVWRTAIGFVTGHLKWIAAGLAVVVIGSTWLYVRGAEQAKARVGILQARVAQLEADARQNQTAFESCERANAANRREAELQAGKAQEAQLRLMEALAHADRDTEDAHDEAERLRAVGGACPAIDDEFRRVFGNP